MISLEFKIDEAELAEDLKDDIPNVNLSLFVMSYFMMPVRMRVNNIDLFEYHDDPWSEAPIMNIAFEGLAHVEELKEMKKVTYDILEGPGVFELSMIDDIHTELVFKGFRPTTSIVNYDDLLNAFQQFADNVRKFLWERVPQMNEHPYWGPWLRGERID